MYTMFPSRHRNPIQIPPKENVVQPQSGTSRFYGEVNVEEILNVKMWIVSVVREFTPTSFCTKHVHLAILKGLTFFKLQLTG